MELYSVNLRMGLYARIVVVGQFAGDKVCERERARASRKFNFVEDVGCVRASGIPSIPSDTCFAMQGKMMRMQVGFL